MRSKIVILSFVLSSILKATPNCPQSHCSHISKKLNDFCIANGMQGKPFLVLNNGQDCFCPCSCVTADTRVSLSEDEYIDIKELNKKHKILTPLGEQQTADVYNILRSEILHGEIYRIKFSNGTKLKVSENHTFVSPAYLAIKASELKVGDYVLDYKEQESKVIGIEKIKNFKGDLYNIIVAPALGKGEDHVFVTNDILSGDFLLQSLNDSIKTGIDIRLELLWNKE